MIDSIDSHHDIAWRYNFSERAEELFFNGQKNINKTMKEQERIILINNQTFITRIKGWARKNGFKVDFIGWERPKISVDDNSHFCDVDIKDYIIASCCYIIQISW